MRLKGWQLLAIALSIAWAIGAGIYLRDMEVERAERSALLLYEGCVRSKVAEKIHDFSACTEERQRNVSKSLDGSWVFVASVSLIPIPLGWFAGFILAMFVRVQVAGFRVVVPWAALTIKRKVFVATSLLTAAFGVLILLLVALAFYAESKVPVTLGSYGLASEGYGDVIVASGTWVREPHTTDPSAHPPLQTSKIQCIKKDGLCTEARAFVAGNKHLMVDTFHYPILSWSDTTIIFYEQGICAMTTFTIDRTTKTVSGITHLPKFVPDDCGDSAKTRLGDRFRLSKGFDVYWREIEKARPLPLRVLAALLK